MSHDNGHQEPVSLESYRRARRPRPTIPPPPQRPAPQAGMSRFIAELVALAIEAHEQRHHGRAS
jgi:hypothetical protein